MKLNCAIIDDEELAADILEEYIKQFEGLVLIAKCKNVVEAYNLLQKTKIDLLFLDIQMPMLTGIDFLKNINNPPKVIFTTAYSEYAVEGFELNAVDYLLKPISFERFLRAINKLQLSDIKSPDIQTKTTELTEEYSEAFIFLKEDKMMVKVMLKDILFIESLKNYVKVKTISKDIITYKTISSLEEKLPSNKFIRVHRSYIVAVDKIDAFSTSQLEIGKHLIPLGRNFKADVLKFLNCDTQQLEQ